MKRFLFVLISLLLAGGCASIRTEPATEFLVQLDDIATGPLQTRPAIVEMDGKPALLYSTKDDRVAFQLGDKRQLLDETARVKLGGSYFQLQRHGQNLDALWWSHEDGKNIYFTTSADGGERFAPVSMVNDEHGVLPPYSLMRGPQDIVGITYLDERQPNYQAYFNRSTDNGRTWPRPDQRLDTPPAAGQNSYVQEPQSVQAGKAWISAWTDVVRAEQTSYRIVSRRSEDAGLNWTPPQVLYSSGQQISSLVVSAQGGSMVIAADEHERGIFALTSQDEGRNWQAAGLLAGSDNVVNSGVDMALAGGRAHLVWMQERKDEKTRIMRASLDIAQAKWLGAAQRLDVKAHENTKSLSPVVLASGQGPLFAAWVDYRDIRPNIYLSASYDQGQAWSAPQALLKPGALSAGWPQLLAWGDQAAIAYETYPTDVVKDGKFVLRLLPVGKDGAQGLSGLPGVTQISEAERKARLEQRVKSLWESRVADNYEPTYEMFDFAFKASTPKKLYLDNVGVITYLSFSVEDVSITGNEANVKMKLKYEVKPTFLPSTGKKVSLAPVDVEVTNPWVWVENDWYMVFAPSYEPPQLKY